MMSTKAVVIRGGETKAVDGTDLVPGDVVKIALGDKIPADLRMFRTINMANEEAALTGEAVPVDKNTDKFECDPALITSLLFIILVWSARSAK